MGARSLVIAAFPFRYSLHISFEPGQFLAIMAGGTSWSILLSPFFPGSAASTGSAQE